MGGRKNTLAEYCSGCIYFDRAGETPVCGYLLRTMRRRPCPPGEGCTVKCTSKEEGKMPVKKSWDAERALRLHGEGLDDLSIAEQVGASLGAIKAWRARNHLKVNRDAKPAPVARRSVHQLPAAVSEPFQRAEDIPCAAEVESAPSTHWETPEKPPLGAMPKNLWDDMRADILVGAITRYAEARFAIPLEWVEELNGMLAAGALMET